jgi:hypothetical protein
MCIDNQEVTSASIVFAETVRLKCTSEFSASATMASARQAQYAISICTYHLDSPPVCDNHEWTPVALPHSQKGKVHRRPHGSELRQIVYTDTWCIRLLPNFVCG